MFGILNIDKPQGLTSHDVVSKLRKILNMKKIGHTGTLDPLATGVLPICVGKATRVIQYLDNSKAYRATIKLGVKTDSYDTDGQTLETNVVELDIDSIKRYLNDFKGEITQTPPMHSAVHYKGKRLYEYARKNIEIKDIPQRTVNVNNIELIEALNEDSQNPSVVIDVDCSTGTYIRSIIHDLGEKLGYGATMEGLTRLRSGSFKISDSYTIEKIQMLAEDSKQNEALINPVDAINLKRLDIDESRLEKIKFGQYFKVESNKYIENEKIKLVYDSSLVAIAIFKEGKINPECVFI